MSLFLSFLTLVLLLSLLSRIFIPKYTGMAKEGNLISEYYNEADRNICHDVLFVGDCEMYTGIVPPLLWDKYAITSYVRGSPGQTVEQSYYLIKEMLSYEKPTAVILGVYGLCHDVTEKEAYNRMTFDGMRFSAEKFIGVARCKREEESILSYIFPLFRYHTRWETLEDEDLKYMFDRPSVSHNGYLMQKGVSAREYEYQSGEADRPISRQAFHIVDEILTLCKDKDVELILMKGPLDSWQYPWYGEWDKQIKEYAEQRKIKFCNLSDTSIGIYAECDSYDGGMHLNVYGAEKVTEYIGEILSKSITIKEKSPHITQIWEEKVDRYREERE